ncbi:MAG: hypothetical protein WA895_36960 [Streptosporangiaceae bacterium]
MYHATMATISAEQTRDIREQAAARRRAQEARGPVRARSASPLALIARNTRSLTGQKRQGSAAA